jgi:hypothetical protein
MADHTVLPDSMRDAIVIDEFGCWVWQKHVSRDGYGMTSVRCSCGEGRRPERMHRVTYRLFVGDVEPGLVIDHLCRNRACCNPDHLEAVTTRENVRRGISPPAVNARKTVCVRGHVLPEGGEGRAQCHACAKILRDQWKERAGVNQDGSPNERGRRVLNALTIRPKSARMLAEQLGWSHTHVLDISRTLVANGHARRTSKGLVLS